MIQHDLNALEATNIGMVTMFCRRTFQSLDQLRWENSWIHDDTGSLQEKGLEGLELLWVKFE